jgi:hypothetical protein
MKPLLLALLLAPLPLLAQIDTATQPAPVRPRMVLRPIQFREIPYVHTSSSTDADNNTTHSSETRIHRIYTYDGIDVDNPYRELWPYLDALDDEDVHYQHLQFDDILARQETANGIGTAIALPGLIMMTVGLVQARAYQDALEKQQAITYNTPAPTPAPVATGPTIFNCSAWTGIGNRWTCNNGPFAGQTINYDPFKSVTPAPSVVTPTPTSSARMPNAVTLPDGKGLAIGGLVAFFVGIGISVSARGDAGSAFLKAVQYYNRALDQKFSWEMQPYSQFGATGFRLVGRF